MSFDLTGINIINEYYTNHYFSTIFATDAAEAVSRWRAAEERNPWSLLRESAKKYYPFGNKFREGRIDTAICEGIEDLAESYLDALGYGEPNSVKVPIDDTLTVPVFHEVCRDNKGTPHLWVLLSVADENEKSLMESKVFFDNAAAYDLDEMTVDIENEDLVKRIFFDIDSPPRFVILINQNRIALLDRNKWTDKRYIDFNLDDIFGRREETTLQAMSVLLHKESLCPDDGKILLDTYSDNSVRNAQGVSKDLKYSLRECIEELGNEVLYYYRNTDPGKIIDAGELSIQCLRYMYRMLFVLFIEARSELNYAPIKDRTYFSGYSLESLRDIADSVRDDVDEVGDGYYLHETLAKLYQMMYDGYPVNESDYAKLKNKASVHDTFTVAPLKGHIFDPEYTSLITGAKLRNRVMLRIIDLMSLTRKGDRHSRRSRISYSNLGINQLGAVYEALLSYRGFIAEEDLYEVKSKGDSFNELDVGYFVTADKLGEYDEDERVRYDDGSLRMYPKGKFIYRLAGREREKSASYYTPECLTQCLVKYALKELLKDKTAEEILNLTICEPAMGSAAFLNEAVNQLAEAYLTRKQRENPELKLSANDRQQELQKVKMYIADRNVYGVDLNPVAVELAEVSLWLNNIFEGGYVPWFGAQLVNGNSLIGARRQGYAAANLSATTAATKWFNNAPDRIPFSRSSAQSRRIYHFLLGDPGMCNYTDKVIKSLEPEKIEFIKRWNKDFTKPYSDSDIEQLKELSKVVDSLWKKQIKERKKLREFTTDELDIFGHSHSGGELTLLTGESCKSIRQKDEYLAQKYKTEAAMNSGAYARLKFAMDYWCSLWFWPIDKAEELPDRNEFIFDMWRILKGVSSVTTRTEKTGALDFNGVEEEVDVTEITTVNLDELLKEKRFQIVRNIANVNKFMHWELEFAEVFAERGGFDLTIGNPPWVKLTWTEQGVLSDKNPMFAVKKLTATQTANERAKALEYTETYNAYFEEYESMTGQQSFLGAKQNYAVLVGQQTDLFRCFLPQAWEMCNEKGVCSFIHPDGVYSDQNADAFREIMYSRLRYHFQFINERMLFPEVAHSKVFSINVYSSIRPFVELRFNDISNLFDPKAVDECYSVFDGEAEGIKDSNGEWSIKGHHDRIIEYGIEELRLLKKFWGETDESIGVKLISIQTKQLLDTIRCFINAPYTIKDTEVYVSEMWHETYSQNDGTIVEKTGFTDTNYNMICSGPHISVANPLSKTPRAICEEKGDYDCVDLTSISKEYMARSKYQTPLAIEDYTNRIADVYEKKYTSFPRLVSRKMLNLKQERTFNVAVLPEKYGHINGIVGIVFKNEVELYRAASTWASIPFDFFVKVIGKQNFNYATIQGFPILSTKYDKSLIIRMLILNCLNINYADFYKTAIKYADSSPLWSKQDPRLDNKRFSSLTSEWNWNTPLRTDYERRQALVEIDVLTAMALGMTLQQLKTIYRIQFPVLQQYESDTWYDANGRIVFTTNRSLTGVGFDRPTWEREVKGAEAGKKFCRTITDDTQPGGPVERTIEYVAPFDRCDREQDYETAWKFFEEKYGE